METQYNQVIVNDIDIIETYKKLMEASTGQGSAYLRAKETLIDMYKSINKFSRYYSNKRIPTVLRICSWN